MLELIVKHNGIEVSRLKLESGREYVIGRAPECDIVVEGPRGISRQHAKVVEENAVWRVSVTSKHGRLFVDSAAHDSIELKNGSVFSIPPFVFECVMAVSEELEAPIDFSEKSLVVTAPVSRDQAQVNQSPTDQDERTMIGQVRLESYLKIQIEETGQAEVFKLEGQRWLGGRDPGCDIYINCQHVSRKHFEIIRTQDGFFIKDLGSANGLSLNGEALEPQSPIQIVSGDQLSIKSVRMHFESRNPQFAQMSAALSPVYPQPAQAPGQVANFSNFEAFSADSGPGVVRIPAQNYFGGRFQKFMNKKMATRGAIALMIPILIWGILRDPQQSSDQATLNSSEEGSPLVENLTPGQQSAIKDALNLAGSLYRQGKYELCLAELKKLHDLTPQFQNSKELQDFCENGSKLLAKAQANERERQEAEKTKEFIAEEVVRCRAELTPTTSLEDIESCLSAARERDPGNEGILGLIGELQERELEKARKREIANEQRQLAQAGRRQYSLAKSLYGQGELSKSIKEYQKFLRGSYSGLSDLESTARRELASIQSELTKKVSELLATCQQNLESAQFKSAYLACKKASEEDPSHQEAKSNQDLALSELKRELKLVYEDSILEESLGNVDQAKEKWKKIMEADIKGGEYFLKARSKLRSHGIGL